MEGRRLSLGVASIAGIVLRIESVKKFCTNPVECRINQVLRNFISTFKGRKLHSQRLPCIFEMDCEVNDMLGVFFESFLSAIVAYQSDRSLSTARWLDVGGPLQCRQKSVHQFNFDISFTLRERSHIT